MYYPKHIRGPAFQLSESRSAELYSEHSVSVPAPLNANEFGLSTPIWGALPAYVTLRERKRLMLTVACANVYGGCNTMACGDFFVQPNQFDPESDPEGDASEEVQTLWQQQDISEWLGWLNNVSLFVCVVTVTAL